MPSPTSMNGYYAPRPDCIPGDIVITGLSAKLPESSNIEEFANNLFNGVDMVNDDPRRWPAGLYDLPSRFGKIKDADLENFDQQFFSVNQKQAECMDPQLRMLMELTYEAIIDAGINPQDIRGSRTGVYIGASNSEIEQYWSKYENRVSGYGLSGCARAMFANRLSFSFDFKGPSVTIDTACSSSLFAMEHAFEDMRSGKCDSAIVGGSNLILHPTMYLQYKRLGMLSADGMCKSFDKSGNGYVRSEGCGVIFMQMAKNARRVYASVLNVRTNTDGYKENGISYPNGAMQLQLIRETYADIGLNPAEVVYVEAHGTGTKVGDPQEVNSITDFFCCEDRKTPLLIGSVKSNMGHSEPASGISAIAKMLIAMETGVIPGNLNYRTQNPDLYGIVNGRLKVVDRNTQWNGGIIGVSSFGFGGANAHVILKSNPKPKVLAASVLDTVPRLLVVSGRTRNAVEMLLDHAEKHKHDEEFLGLINEIHAKKIPLYYHRGYAVIGNGETHREIIELVEENRPIWYIYSGMGSQWAGMARDLMQVDVFKKSIHKCAEALRPKGIDLIDIVTKKDEKIFANILNSFISIAATQVALTDLLTNLGISPSGIVGHSVGEICCAYADGCLTAEQTMLVAYWRGRSIIESKLIPGAMAAVGLSWEECYKRLPNGVVPACHNSADNVTISGPTDVVKNFVETLIAEGIFAKAVNSSGIAFHSKYIAEAGPKLRESLEGIIPNPKDRTSRWVSTSIPESAWSTPLANQSSVAYHVNNLLSPVLFHEAVQHIPKNAICIEIAPTGLLQAILKRSLGSGVTNLSLLKKNNENNLKFLLSNVGQLYAAGAQPFVPNLSRPISYPVSRGTPMLNSKISWDHSQKILVPNMFTDSESSEIVIDVDLSKDEYLYLTGHIIDGRFMFPGVYFITVAWRSFAKTKNLSANNTPVILDDVVFHRPIIIPRDGSVKFGIKFFDGSGRFEICESGTLIVSGFITIPEEINSAQLQLKTIPADASEIHLTKNEIYKELRLRGYDYDGKFQGIASARHCSSNSNEVTGKLHWDDSWVSFLDTMLQFSILGRQRELYLPISFERIVINPIKHYDIVDKTKDVPVYMYRNIKVIQSGGIEIRGLKTSLATRRTVSQAGHIMESHQFVSAICSSEVPRAHAIAVSVQIAIENSSGALKIKVVDVVGDRAYEYTMAAAIESIIEGEPLLVSDVTIATSQSTQPYIQEIGTSHIRVVNKDITKGAIEQNCHLVSAYDVTTSSRADIILRNLIASIKEDGFILLEESKHEFNMAAATKLFDVNGLGIVSVQQASGKFFFLLRGKVDISERNKQIVVVTEKSFNWLGELKAALATAEQENRYVYVVSQGEELFGALGFINCIKYEAGGRFARLVYIQDVGLEKFSFDGKLYTEQLSQDLISQVYNQGKWGTYRHLKLENNNTAKFPVNHAYVNALMKGDLSSLKWIESPLSRITAKKKTEELCTVYYAPINFRDVMISSGKLAVDALPGDLASRECILGVEFAGRDSTGKRIMALVEAKALATTCLANRSIMWDVPNNWTMEQASTIPAVYSTVYYAMVIRGRMRKGETILIHAGSGGVGLAAISVALSYGLTVYTTVGSDEKRAYLKKTFPKLTDAHIANSRNTSFEQHIMSETNGRGVNLVLNSLAGEMLLASLRCLGLNGRFLEIGKLDMNNNTAIGMSMLLKNTTIHGILLDSVMFGDDEDVAEIVRLVSEGIKSGAVRPLPVTVFNENQVEQAFRFMASGKHIGKVVVRVRQEEEHVFKPNTLNARLIPSIPRTYMYKEKSYIIVGGLGGIGLQLANWMVMRGATKLVLTSRSGVKTAYQEMMIQRWKELGVSVLVDTNDVTTLKGAENLLSVSNLLGPVGGIFNLAATLRDGLLENATEADFSAVWRPKVDATKQLDVASRKLCQSLDYFVCFSSISCGRGNIGQTTYGLANSTMERICERRKKDGLVGTAIQWGAIGDTGLVIESLGDNETIIGGTLPQRIVSLLASMDIFLQQHHAVLASMVIAEKHKTVSSGVISLVRCVANILGIKDLNSVPDQLSLADLGMDSLMATEIKQTLERSFDIVLSAEEIRLLPFGKLNGMQSGGEVAAEGQKNMKDDINRSVFRTKLLPTKCLVQLDSKAAADSKIRPLFIAHAIEGFVAAMVPLAAQLKCPVWGLECTSECPLQSLPELAMFYVNQIKKIQAKGPYSVAGYSFGAAVAFEIVVELERRGDKAQLIMVDGSPIVVLIAQKQQLLQMSSDTISDVEAVGLSVFGLLCGNLNYKQTVNQLVMLPKLEDRLAAITNLVTASIGQPSELVSTTALLFLKKLMLANYYRPESKVNANVTLFRATEYPGEVSVDLADDYELSKVCKGEVNVVMVKGNHRTILQGDSLNKIVKMMQILTV